MDKWGIKAHLFFKKDRYIKAAKDMFNYTFIDIKL